jgi:cytidylate kinase
MRRIVTISREYGSGGRIIGKLVAQKLSLPFYDREIIDRAVEKSGLSREIIESVELRAKSSLSYSFASTMSFGEGFMTEPVSMNEKLFLCQFDVIRQIGESNEGVIVGRCADYILKDLPGVTNVFLYADYEDRVKRCISSYGVTEDEVKQRIKDYDKARANYYHYHTSQTWGDYRNYNLSLNTSYIEDERAADLIVSFMNTRIYKESEEENEEE